MSNLTELGKFHVYLRAMNEGVEQLKRDAESVSSLPSEQPTIPSDVSSLNVALEVVNKSLGTQGLPPIKAATPLPLGTLKAEFKRKYKELPFPAVEKEKKYIDKRYQEIKKELAGLTSHFPSRRKITAQPDLLYLLELTVSNPRFAVWFNETKVKSSENFKGHYDDIEAVLGKPKPIYSDLLKLPSELSDFWNNPTVSYSVRRSYLLRWSKPNSLLRKLIYERYNSEYRAVTCNRPMVEVSQRSYLQLLDFLYQHRSYRVFHLMWLLLVTGRRKKEISPDNFFMKDSELWFSGDSKNKQEAYLIITKEPQKTYDTLLEVDYDVPKTMVHFTRFYEQFGNVYKFLDGMTTESSRRLYASNLVFQGYPSDRIVRSMGHTSESLNLFIAYLRFTFI